MLSKSDWSMMDEEDDELEHISVLLVCEYRKRKNENQHKLH
jgi:hypothetical protein